MTLPPNFGQAYDLSGLGKPKADVSMPLPGLEVTARNLTPEFFPISATKPVIIICWTARSAESVETLRIFGKFALEDEGAWVLGRVDVDAEPALAQALQTQSVPYGIVLIGEQPIPFLDQVLPETLLRERITKIMALAAEQGVGSAPEEKAEPEEDEALEALDRGDYDAALAAYERLLARKPNDMYGKLGLAQVALLKRTDGVDADQIMKAAIESPDDIDLQLQCADVEIMAGYLEPGFKRLLNLIAILDGAEQKRVKDRLLELFQLVDPADPRVIKARAALANALF